MAAVTKPETEVVQNRQFISTLRPKISVQIKLSAQSLDSVKD